MKKGSIKNNRINKEVGRELGVIIRELKDPRIAMMTTVVAVEVATDLKTAKVFISVLGDDKAKEDTMEGLKSAKGFIRKELAHTINLRNTPELEFVYDESIEYGMKLSKMIDDLHVDSDDESDTEEAQNDED